MVYSLCSLSMISAKTHKLLLKLRPHCCTQQKLSLHYLKTILVFFRSDKTFPTLLKKKNAFNVLAKTLPAQQCLLTESIQQVHLQSTRHQGLRQLREEAFEGSSHSVYGEVFLH